MFQIKNRWTGSIQFVGELSAEIGDASYGVKLGFAIKKAIENHADLSHADLSHADFTDARFTGADFTRARFTDAIPVVSNIDTAILAAVEGEAAIGALDMLDWHKCDTTHCRAGWAITLAGDAGRDLERRYGPAAAGAMIYAASRPGKRVPNFYASTEDALTDLRACAAEEAAGSAA